LVIDCAEPHVLADWWAETLRWIVEPQDEAFIRSMIKQGFVTDEDTTEHRGRLVWREGAAINAPPTAPTPGLRILFQQVPEPKQGKNRLHFDVRPGDVSVEDLRERLVARGATKLGEGHQGQHTWFVMADPEGNEFCV
jgi:Glyoxalase-like domain